MKSTPTKYFQLATATVFGAALLLTGCGESKILTGSETPEKKVVERSVQGDIVGNAADVWFVKPSDDSLELVKVQRKYSGKNKLESALTDLLRGPNGEEEAQGLASEIPKGTVLLGVRELDDDFEVDLSQRFSSGGGEASMQTRLDQLKKTVKSVVGERKVYLNVEGKRLVATGEGLEVQQPINY